ncbi:MAG: hypothetical protein HY903_12620 [Deltaproteobacteria bacterium]|nr:hypothetical protein [Deltaproteobacteria bacterium]
MVDDEICPAPCGGDTSGADNTPGARNTGAAWRDPAGNLWLFGGDLGFDSAGNSGELDDLWRYGSR